MGACFFNFVNRNIGLIVISENKFIFPKMAYVLNVCFRISPGPIRTPLFEQVVQTSPGMEEKIESWTVCRKSYRGFSAELLKRHYCI